MVDWLSKAPEVRKQNSQQVIVRITSDHLRGLALAKVPVSMFVRSIMETTPFTLPDDEDGVEGLEASDLD